MQHCEKLGGRSPPVTTLGEWENLVAELETISEETFYDYMWTSATEGDKDGASVRLSHWPQTEVVGGESIMLEAKEGVWRDYYTGLRLTDFAKPYDDAFFGEDYNCLEVHTDEPWNTSWNGIQCHTYENVCPCQYTSQPILVLRGAFLFKSSCSNLFVCRLMSVQQVRWTIHTKAVGQRPSKDVPSWRLVHPHLI